jgi:DNA-binding transcriptional LysR family regulator
MDRLRAYQVFAVIVARGGFARAASELQTSPANVSRLIQQLELGLGTKLLERTSRRLQLTDSGREVYERVRGILDEVAELEAGFAEQGKAASGRIKINAPMTFGQLWLSPLLPQFASRYPEIEIDIRYSDRLIEMAEDEFDVAVRISAVGAESHISRRLAHTQMLLCASPTLLGPAGSVEAVEMLRAMPRIGYLFSDSRNAWTLWAADGSRHEIDTPCAFTCANGFGMKAAALRGQGLVLLPDFLVHRELASGELTLAFPELHAEAMEIRMIYADRRHLSRRARLFIDFVADRFRRVPWDTPSGSAGRTTGRDDPV